MTEILNEIISTLVQVGIFTLIPFIFFLFRKDKRVSFARYIGLYKPTGKSVLYVLLATLFIVLTGVGLVYFDETTKQAVMNPPSVTGILRNMGISFTTLIILLIVAIFKTALAEEILFRGLIAKQLIKKMGFKTGNMLQAVIFGLVHVLLFWVLTKTTIQYLIFIFVFSFIAAYIIGYIKEKYAKGSIVPGWIGHGLGNTLSYLIITFVL